LHRKSYRDYVNDLAQARPDYPTLAIRSRRNESNLSMAQESSKADTDKHRGWPLGESS